MDRGVEEDDLSDGEESSFNVELKLITILAKFS